MATKKRQYFTKVHEDAILQFCEEANLVKREKLYRELILPVLVEMIDKIVFTYKFVNVPNISELKNDCLIYVTMILSKFDVSKGYKAFSYFSVIIKNWFNARRKEATTNKIKLLDIESIAAIKEVDKKAEEENQEEEKKEFKEFWETFCVEIDKWETLPSLRENDRKVIKAIKILIQNLDDIEDFNKKVIYVFLREITNLNTKQIINSLVKIRSQYKRFKANWIAYGSGKFEPILFVTSSLGSGPG